MQNTVLKLFWKIACEEIVTATMQDTNGPYNVYFAL